MRDIHICFSTDDGFVPYCAVAMKSIMINAEGNDKLFFYILHAGLTESAAKMLRETGYSSKSSIALVGLDKEIFKDMPMMEGEHFSRAEAYFRFAIPRIFPDLEKVLYLDCDVLVRKSLLPLYSIDVREKSAGMIKDNAYELGILRKHDYNSGVMLINCKKWRDENIEYKLLQYAKENYDTIQFVDQGVINSVLQNDILALDDKYNTQIRMENLSDELIEEIMQDGDITILHYVTPVKPWHGVYQNKLTDEYYAYMERSGIEYRDLRGRNKNIDKKKYYEYQACLRYLFDKKIINKNMTLFFVFEEKTEQELEFAAIDLNFSHAKSTILAEIDKKSVDQDFMIIVSCDYNRITKEMYAKGYIHEKDYVLLRSTDHERIEKELVRSCVNRSTKVAVYGTAGWAGKCTEVLNRLGVEIPFYLDSDKTKSGGRLYGKEIIHPDMLACKKDYDKIVIASSAYKEITEFLLSLGIRDESMICFDSFMQ